MDGRLSSFLQYDYAEAKDLAKAFLAVSAVLFGSGIVFAKEFIRLGDTDRLAILRSGMIGLYLFAFSTVLSGVALLSNYEGMLKLLHRYQGGIANAQQFAGDVATHNRGMDASFMIAGTFVIGGILFLLRGAYENSPANQAKVEVPQADIEGSARLATAAVAAGPEQI